MIDQKDLRIGNLTKQGIIFQITMKDGDQGCYILKNELASVPIWYKSEDIEPIPLDKEWLRKCNVIIKSVQGSTVIIRRLAINIHLPDYIRSVHELQNWYYWKFDKEELPINPQ